MPRHGARKQATATATATCHATPKSCQQQQQQQLQQQQQQQLHIVSNISDKGGKCWANCQKMGGSMMVLLWLSPTRPRLAIDGPGSGSACK